MRYLIVLLCLLARPALAEVAVTIGYLKVEVPPPATLTDLDPVIPDAGLAGARVGLAENATTAKFLGQTYALDEVVVPVGGDALAAAEALRARTPLLLVDAPAEVLLAVADAVEGALVFNVSAEDVGLRDTDCRANLLHTIPSLAMRTAALAQFLVLRRWTELPMISGTFPQDVAYADSLKRSLGKFGLRPAEEKVWAVDADMRRAASAEMPLFTQGFGDYDALIVADEAHDFGRFLMFNTWEARPVVGSEGLTAVAWAPVIENWGAAQLQNRFVEAAGRGMGSVDYAAWAAVRSIGEAVTRTGAADVGTLRAYILSDAFGLAGFKGAPLSFRDWNGQLRQPIALVHPRALVATAPLEGFLHQTNEMDSLGLDRPESQCEAFR